MITPTESTDLSFNVVAGAQIFIASWILPTTISSSPVVSGELIVNDIFINSTSAASGYNSIKLNDQEMRTGRYVPLPALINGREYSVRLIVNANNQRYYAPTKIVIPSGIAEKPEINCIGLNNGIQIDILNYSSVQDESNGYAVVTKYEVFYNNFCKIYDASNVLILSSVSNNTEYEIAVRAINANGISEFSSTKTATPSSLTVGVSGFAGAVQDQAVLLTWTPPTGMASDSVYKIGKKEGAAGAWFDTDVPKMTVAVDASGSTAAVPSTAVVSYKYELLTNGSPYSFRIAVYNASTGYSSYAFVNNKVPFGAPGVPQFTTAVASQQITIKLCRPTVQNENGKAVTSYILNRFVSGVADPTPLTGSAIDASGCQTFVVTGLTNGVQSSFNAYALNNTNPDSKSVAQLINATPYGAPGAVTGLAAVGTDNSVTLSWVAPAENGGSQSLMYRVTYQYQNSAAGVLPVTYATETMSGITGLSQLLSINLKNGVSTTFNVFAYFTQGSEYTSASASIDCVPFKAPDAISEIIAVMDASNNISYSWTRPILHNLPFEKYEYKIMLSTGVEPSSWTTLLPNALVVGPTEYGKEHKLIVRTVTMNGTVPVNGGETAKLYTPYKAPSDVQNLAVYPKQTSLDVVWDPPSDKGGYTTIKYLVYVNSQLQDSAGTTAEKVTIGTLTEAKTYLISVVAQGYNGTVAGQKSGIKTKPGIPYMTPSTPSNLKAVPQSSWVDLSWNAATGSDEVPVKYVIFRDDDKIGEVDGLTYKDQGLTKSQAYVYKVMTKQVWSSGYTSYSDFIGPVTATPYSAPNTVSNLNVAVTDSLMTVTWSPLTLAQKGGIVGTPSYQVVISHMETTENVDLDQTTTGTSITKSLTNGVAYTIKVKAIMYNGEIAANVPSADVIQYKTVNKKPAGPLPGSVSFLPGNEKITVQWFSPTSDPSYAFVKYEFQVDGAPAGDSTLNVTSGTKNSKDISSLTNGVSKIVKIRRVGSIGTVGTAGYLEDYSEWVESSAVVPFGKPILSAPVISGKTVNFSVNPNGSGLIQIMVFAATDKYTQGDQAYQLAEYSGEAATGTVNKTITLNIATGTVINSVFYAVINAAGATTPSV